MKIHISIDDGKTNLLIRQMENIFKEHTAGMLRVKEIIRRRNPAEMSK